MAREKNLLGFQGTDAHYDITETFTHRMVTDDGRILRGDPEARFWFEHCPSTPDSMRTGLLPIQSYTSSWYGEPPRGWNPALAIPEPHTREYDDWWDVS